ncbi:MAG: Gfo/Idh/MocA family oxidoreductase [Phycisphaeraceae bacterium]|nr:Gfo/Idh/MocA family oxidoreductase [Phycisphaeraceae bacterium]
MAHLETPTQTIIRVGAIGLDSSHTLQFSRRMYGLHAQGQTKCRVTSCWDAQDSSDPRTSQTKSEVAAASLRALGIQFPKTLNEFLSSVDAVMVLVVNGNRHFDLAMHALTRRLPTFIDKPLTCSASEAAALLQFVKAHGARCYSASALRFIDTVPDLPVESLGRLISIEANGPFQDAAEMPGLWYYGCHTFELVDSLWSRSGGVRRVRARVERAGHRIILEYHDGRAAVIGLDLTGTSPFTVLLRGETSLFAFEASLSSSYDRLVASICCFFEGEPPAICLENIAETIAVIECAQRSLAQNQAWIELPTPPNYPSPNQVFSDQKI